MRYQDARARKEHYLALQAQRDYERSMGQLVSADDVRNALSHAGTTLRVRLETLPSSLSAQLAAERDEARVRAVLADHIEQLLGELEREFAQTVSA
jgi:phage terminase Nu1 subunit (DNA packaging protein)